MTEPQPPDPTAPGALPGAADQAALAGALQQLLAPLARLAVAQGLPYAAIDELLRLSIVRAAHGAHPDLPEHRRVSRVSAATGLNRREVTRLLQRPAQPLAPARSPVNEVFAHWVSHPHYRGEGGVPLALPRTGPSPSFEALAQEISRDVHPRSFLEELVRLGLAEHDTTTDQVRLSRDAFVPRDDRQRMLDFLGANVGDHLAAAVDNVLSRDERKPHFEQAVFGDGLSPPSVARLREVVRHHWKALSADLVATIETLVAEDELHPERATERVRFGLFSFHEPRPVASAPASPSPSPSPPSPPPTSPPPPDTQGTTNEPT